MQEKIKVGFQAFVSDGGEEFGSVRQVAPNGRPELIIYVENAGDFEVPMDAVKDAEAEKVILDSSKLPPKMLTAIRARENAEDPKLAG